MKSLVVLLALPLLAAADDLPTCYEPVKEELSRQSLSWKPETENRDSEAMRDEYQSQKEIVDRFEAAIPMPARPDYEKYQSMAAYRRALAEHATMTMEANESRRKLLLQTKPEYKSALAFVEKYKTPGEKFFFDFVENGSAEFDKILFFPNKAGAKVTVYLKDDRVQGYHAAPVSGQHDIVRLNYMCKVDGIFVHHGKLLEKINLSICDQLPQLKSLVESAVANPGDDVEDLPLSGYCKQQGGDWDGKKCVCSMKKGKLLEPIDPTMDSCLEERFVSTGQRLRDFTDSHDSHVEADLSALPVVERVCKRYFTLSQKKPAATNRIPAKVKK